MNSIVKQKQQELLKFIKCRVNNELSIQGIITTGSVALGNAREDSDIDAIVFLSPYDLYSIPAEFKWKAENDSFHSIFDNIENTITFDFKRVDLKQWSQSSFVWPEPVCSEITEGWIAFDRNNKINKLVKTKTEYSTNIRQNKIDNSLIFLDQLLNASKAEKSWISLGASIAHDRLNTAYDYLIEAIFAINLHWRPWRNREMSYLSKLAWLPKDFESQLLFASNALSTTYQGYQNRLFLLNVFFKQLMTKCKKDGLYGDSPISEAFIRKHDEPGRCWNINEWEIKHAKREN